ncbi:FeoA family protein [Aminipila sp.]|uniref:FeoA family protein n=1 Tax=Aminipila sp. TaxID=2060095 RepID=UPI001D92204D|nr:FeoA family protein [Aminipila sp.]MBE6035381.1 ferrous iron transport protein A [Clostridiales bacterium]
MRSKNKEQKKENVLSNLKKGQCARVYKMVLDEDIKRRLQDIGLTEGTTVECVQKSPGGDPTAYLIRGAVMALRTEDASKVHIKK